MIINRRNFLVGLGAAAAAAPAIVRAQNIMPVRTPVIWREPKVIVPRPQYRAWMLTEIASREGDDAFGRQLVGGRVTFTEVISVEPFADLRTFRGAFPSVDGGLSVQWHQSLDGPVAEVVREGPRRMTFDVGVGTLTEMMVWPAGPAIYEIIDTTPEIKSPGLALRKWKGIG